MRRSIILGLAILFSALFAIPSSPAMELSPGVKGFVSIDEPVVALIHARVIDGTGAAAVEDQTLIIRGGNIVALGPSTKTRPPAGSKVIDLSGKTVIPGLVGMHDHLFYPLASSDRGPAILALYGDMGFSFPRLYLAAGVTSLRTTGSIAPYTDLELKRRIDAGELVGPKLHLTGPYLEGTGAYTPVMHQLSGPEDARRMVDYWAGEGMTSFKAYMHITRAELSAAIAAAHAKGLKVTGHLCSIGFKEAAQLGIDNLEHGLLVDTEFDPGKKDDVCPPQKDTAEALTKLDVDGPRMTSLIKDLIEHHVAVTSTLPVFETFVANRPPLEQRVLSALAPSARIDYLTVRTRIAERKENPYAVLLAKEMEFEHAFVKAGGLLLAGEDPTGYGGVLAGFGDQREVELLVEAGFTPIQAIHIATANGARFLGVENEVGTIAAGNKADLVVIDGNPAKNIDAIEKVETVFKDGVGYDSAKLIASVAGSVGIH